jgi:hypothetical protein
MSDQNIQDEMNFDDDENFSEMIKGVQIFEMPGNVHLTEQSEEAMVTIMLLLMMPTSPTIH